MGKTIELTDEQDAILEHAANRRGEIAEDLLAEMIEGLREPSRPVYYTTYAFMRHPRCPSRRFASPRAWPTSSFPRTS